MAAHRRKVIRDGVKALVATVADFQNRVYTARVFPVQRDELPCAVVYALDEPVTQVNLARTVQRDLAVVVAIKATGAEDELEDAVDALAVEVEKALQAKRPIDGILEARLERTTTTLDGQTQLPLGSLALVYRVSYRTAAGAPDAFA